ncbi:hypothetical protein ACG1BZ_07620 [Microbulbifer sp. CNSA002]|uniref:hypothetical protein n=1 Tax=unclassified Microbulbifer TaxID=2619833 RepID=UPI0039B5E31C
MKKILPGIALLFCASVLAEEGQSLQGIKVITTAVADKKAVIKLPQEKVRLVAPGDTLVDDRYTVRQILGNRLVLQERGSADKAGDLLWIYVAKDSEESRIQRLSSKPSATALVPGLTESLVGEGSPTDKP